MDFYKLFYGIFSMNSQEFAQKLISLYQKENDRELTYEALGPYLCEIIESDAGAYKMPLRKNTMARILHEFYKNILQMEDLDWQDAGKFPDIYDCKVCANSLAQCYVRGLITPRKHSENSWILGADDLVSDIEIKEILKKINYDQN